MERVQAGVKPTFSMLPPKMSRYILDMSALHQICLLAPTVIVFLMEVVPLELQRRVINDAVKHRNFQMILGLCAVYAGVTLAHGIVKLSLNVYRGWVAQRATRDLRKRVLSLSLATLVALRSNPNAWRRGSLLFLGACLCRSLISQP